MRALAAIAFALPVTAAATLPAIPPDVARAIAELDCLSVSATDVDRTLAKGPAPRVINLQGSVPIVTMEPFAGFLEAMGYPAERLAQPGSTTRSYASFVDSRRLAGQIAWHYEREGMMPMLGKAAGQ